MFFVYINDIVTDIGSNINLFADDTSLFLIVETPNASAIKLQSDVDRISRWADTWLVKFNPAKSESLVISRKRPKPFHPSINMANSSISAVDSHKHLGIVISNNCTWHEQVDLIKNKAWSRINVMKRLRYLLDRKSQELIYSSFIHPIMENADVVWDNCSQYEKDDLDKIQNEAARIAKTLLHS